MRDDLRRKPVALVRHLAHCTGADPTSTHPRPVYPGRAYDLAPTRVNGQLAFGAYLRTRTGGVCQRAGLLVLTLTSSQVCGLTRFDNDPIPSFGLLRWLPG